MIIFCDKNKKLVNKIKKLNLESSRFDFVVSDKDDVLECKKDYPNAKIVTASNPSFSADGGLDLVLKNKYPEQWDNAQEFLMTNDLFFVISCDDNIKSSANIIQRALAGLFAYRNKSDFILTGIGTSIAGLDDDIFIENLKKISVFDLMFVNLSGACLDDSDLSNSYLNNANLSYSILSNSDLSYSNLSYSILSYSDLSNSNLSNSDLSHSYLNNANLSSTNLNDTYLNNSDLGNVDYNSLTLFFVLQCPEEGSFIGFKKAHSYIIKLQITENAKRSSATSRKCRCSEAKVLDIYSIDKTIHLQKCSSEYDETFIYEVGKIVKVDNFDEHRWNECSTGIHFFITEQEAIDY